MKKPIFFLLILSLILYIKCIDYKCRTSDESNLKLGDKAVLCIHFIPNGQRIALPVEVDQYSVVSINGAQSSTSSSLNETTGKIELLAQIGSVTSVFPAVSKKK